MDATDLLPYAFTILAALAVWVGVRRSRATRNGAYMNGQSRLEERIRECEGTIRTLLAENSRKEAEIHQLKQRLIEADQRIWLLEQQLTQAQLDDAAEPYDEARIAAHEEATRIIRLMRDKRNELINLELEARIAGDVPEELEQKMRNVRTAISRLERRLGELQG